MPKKRTVEDLFEEVKETKRYKRVRNSTAIESTLWLILALMTVYTHNWLATMLIAIILIKIVEVYFKNKLMIATQLLVDDLFDLIKNATGVQVKSKGKTVNKLVKEK